MKIVILCPGATTTRFVRQFAGNLIVPNENKALEALRCVPKQRYTVRRMIGFIHLFDLIFTILCIYSSKEVAEHAIQLIETADNGSIWISDNGKLTAIDMTTYCSALTSSDQ